MRDVQNEADDRNLAIDRVGISGISWPISVPDRENGVQETVAEVRHAHEPLYRSFERAGEESNLP